MKAMLSHFVGQRMGIIFGVFLVLALSYADNCIFRVFVQFCRGDVILFAAYSLYGRISVRFSLEIFVILQHCLVQNFSLK